MKTLKVMLWGEELGRLVWNPKSRHTYFIFNPTAQSRPDVSPLLLPYDRWNINMPVYGYSERMYQGLPPFIADSLPDSWGDTLFDQWVRKNRLSRNILTPLYKLMFIGRRGMGALEFQPAAEDLEHRQEVDVKGLYEMSLEVLRQRESTSLDVSENLTMKTLLSVGTSAGGRQTKAIVAINQSTGAIHSGQTDVDKGFEHHIVKFEDSVVPSSEIEMTFHRLAEVSGIRMETCRLLNIDGTNHFLTRRFDRIGNEKIHMQTLAAMAPEARSYEDLMDVCRRLGLDEAELREVFRRLVFNVMANNTDDHNKNFAFLLRQGDRWRLSPAYDMTFIFNSYGTGPQEDRCLSLYGKSRGIDKKDLIDFAADNGIAGAESIIDSVALALMKFSEFADMFGVPSPWRQIILRTLSDTLARFGYIATTDSFQQLQADDGRIFENVSVKINSKGQYDVSVLVDGRRRRRFVRPSNPLYVLFSEKDWMEMDPDQRLRVLESLFPH